MSSLRELQHRFADAVLAASNCEPAFAATRGANAAARLAVYRRAVLNNYRNALAATYPVVKRVVGAPFFNAAVDSFVQAHPSTSGDLNVYGDAFGDFLATYPYAANLPYLPDVARLEWAMDEANHAADVAHAPDAVLAALSGTPPERLTSLRVQLDPSCRLLASDFPVMRIWQVNQPGHQGDMDVAFDGDRDLLLVRREVDRVSVKRTQAGEHVWLASLAAGASLGDAIEAGQHADATFDFTALLRAHLLNGTIASVVTG